jgi:hypothetical protein
VETKPTIPDVALIVNGQAMNWIISIEMDRADDGSIEYLDRDADLRYARRAPLWDVRLHERISEPLRSTETASLRSDMVPLDVGRHVHMFLTSKDHSFTGTGIVASCRVYEHTGEVDTISYGGVVRDRGLTSGHDRYYVEGRTAGSAPAICREIIFHIEMQEVAQ